MGKRKGKRIQGLRMTKGRTGKGELKDHRNWRPAELKENPTEFTVSPGAVLNPANFRPEGCLFYSIIFFFKSLPYA